VPRGAGRRGRAPATARIPEGGRCTAAAAASCLDALEPLAHALDHDLRDAGPRAEP
jgi:hypothetical protein